MFQRHYSEVTDTGRKKSPKYDKFGRLVPEPRDVRAAVTKLKREKWIDSVKQVSSLMSKMDEGAFKLLQPDHHTWREKSENANIYVRNHLSSKDRADLAEYRHENEILKKTQYK